MLPKLAYVCDPHSFGMMSIAEAATDICDLIWILDSSDPDFGNMPRLLSRLGVVVDVAELTEEEAADKVALEGPAGIVCFVDHRLVWTARVADRLGVPFVDELTATRLSDKRAQRESLRAAGLPVPGFWTIDAPMTDDEWSTLERDASFPAILKPRHGGGSRDTVSIASITELREILADGGSELVLETYIPDGDASIAGEGFAGYLSVESVVAEGSIRHLAVTGRTPVATPFRETGLFIPSSVSEETRSAAIEMADRAASAIGVSIGCLHTEIKLTPDGPVVIEVNGRIGGGVPEILELASGYRILQIAFRVALGEHVELEEIPECSCVAYYLMIQAPTSFHRITAIEGLDDLRSFPGVESIFLNRGVGQAVDWREGNHGYVYSVTGAADDHDALRGLVTAVPSIVRISGE